MHGDDEDGREPGAFHSPRGPACLVFADDPARRRRLADTLSTLDGRVLGSGPLADAAPALATLAGTAVVVLDLGGAAAPDALLDALGHAVADGRASAALLLPPALIDVVAARIAPPGVALLVDPEPMEIVAALQPLLARRPGVAEPGGDDNARRLAALSEEAARIARALASLSQEDAVPPIAGEPQDEAAALSTVRALIRLRRLREQFFDRTLFADPAWDMLLDLHVARLERRRVAVSSLCIAAAVPPTTALRWIGAMTEQGLLVRQADPDDGRRAFIALSDAAAGAMAGYAAAAARVLARDPGGR